MSRFLFFLALAAAVPARADAPLAVRGDPLPAGAVARLGIPGKVMNESVSAGGHTPGGSFRVAVARDTDIRVWAWGPAHARPPVHLLTGHAAAVHLLALSPDARFLATADKAGEVRVWELVTGESDVLTGPGEAVTALAVGPGGRRVVVAAGRTVTLHDRSHNRQVKVGTHERDVTALALSPDGRRLATADAKGRIAVWSADGTKVADLPWDPIPEPQAAPPIAPPIKGAPGVARVVIDFAEGVRKLAFSPDGTRLAAGGGTVVRAWDIPDRRVLWQHHRHSQIYSDTGFGFSGALPREPAGPRQLGGAWDLAFSRDGRFVASAGFNGDVRVVHADHGEDARPDPSIKVAARDRRFTGRVGLAFGPDGRSLTLFEGSRRFVREAVVRGTELDRVAGHQSSVTGLAVSADGRWLASAGDDSHIRLWRVGTGECVADLPAGHSGGRGTAFSPDGQWLAAGGAYHGFTVFEKRDDPPTFAQRKGYDTLPWRVHAFLPGHDARLHVATQYGQSRSVDLADRKQHGVGFSVNNEPRHLAVSPDGKWAAVAFGYSSTPAPRVFDLATGKEAPAVEGMGGSHAIDSVQFSPDSRLLAGAGQSGVFLWQVGSWKKYLSLGKHERTTEAVAFSPDGRLLASAGDKDIKLWEVATGRLLGARQSDGWAVLSLAFLPQPGRLASADTEGAVLVWDVSKELRAAGPVPKELGRGVSAPAETGLWARRFPLEGRLGGVAFSPDGKALAAGTATGRIELFDLKAGKRTGTLDGHTSEVRAILYAPDGKTVLSTGHLWDGKDLPVRAWDAATGKPRWARADTGTFPEAIGLSPDGKTVYVTGNKGIPRWDVATGEPLDRVKAYDEYTGSMAVSPDGKHLMVGGFKQVVLWDLAANKKVRTWTASEDEHSNFAQALAFSPDGKAAVTTAADGRVRLWDVATGDRKAEWRVGGHVSAAAFSPKGDLIAFAGCPVISGHLGGVTVWDPKAGTELLRLTGLGPRVAWSPDGKWLATADVRPHEKEQYVLLWDVAALLGR